jgi:5'-methylthioadenosine phosphorylase
MAIAIIGGTGVYDLGAHMALDFIATPYGDAAVYSVEMDGQEILFIPRHGVGHTLPPHRVNYRANIWAIQSLGVRETLAFQAVGSLNPRMAPGDFVLLSQFIDLTKCRPSTFFDGDDGVVLHADMTHPYCQRMIEGLVRAGEAFGERFHAAATYACMEGPRFETAAEIRMLNMMGADVVGMTNVPEVVLAREAGVCYATVCTVCNWAAGMTKSPLTMEEVLGIMTERTAELRELMHQYLASRVEGACSCVESGFQQYLPRL